MDLTWKNSLITIFGSLFLSFILFAIVNTLSPKSECAKMKNVKDVLTCYINKIGSSIGPDVTMQSAEEELYSEILKDSIPTWRNDFIVSIVLLLVGFLLYYKMDAYKEVAMILIVTGIFMFIISGFLFFTMKQLIRKQDTTSAMLFFSTIVVFLMFGGLYLGTKLTVDSIGK
jgi:di/tricarboxylate transporter